jgi:hypothetical protein
LQVCEDRLDPRGAPGTWGEFLRIRGLIHEQTSRPSAAYHDFAQSANVFDLLGERYQAALSHLSMGRLSAEAGSMGAAERYLKLAEDVFTNPRRAARSSMRRPPHAPCWRAERPRIRTVTEPTRTTRLCGGWSMPQSSLSCSPAKPQRRCWKRWKPIPWSCSPCRRPEIFVCWQQRDRTRRCGRSCRAASQGTREHRGNPIVIESLGRHHDGPRFCALVDGKRRSESDLRRFRMFAAVARQGFELCGARERPAQASEHVRRAIARTAAAGFRLRQRGDEPSGGSDPADAGPQPDGVDHRRERHRQGSRGAGDPCRVGAQHGHVPALQLHHHHA